MPRTLPWATTTPKPSTSSASSPRPPIASPRRSPSSPLDLVDRDLNPINPPTASPKRAPSTRQGDEHTSTILTPSTPRHPSSSPPPPVSAPPAIAYMLPGPAADDRWLLVEDEFLAVAQRFTSPLHAAEYARVKRLARARGAAALRALPRATDGRTPASTPLKRKLEAGARAGTEGKRKNERTKGKGGVHAEGGGARVNVSRRSGIAEEDEDRGQRERTDAEEREFRDPLLAGLMTTSQARADWRDAPRVVGVGRARTRAAAGFGQSPNTGNRKRDALAEERAREGRADVVGGVVCEDTEEGTAGEDEETDDDDLDIKTYGAVQQLSKLAAADQSVGPAGAATNSAVLGRERSTLSARRGGARERTHDVTNSSKSASARSSPLIYAVRHEISTTSQSKGGKGTQLAERIAQRKAEAACEQAKKAPKHGTKLMDEVPTFLV